MRDTGCTGCVIRSSLVSKDQLLGKASDVTLINETTQRYPLALIDIDCPFFSGQTEALCMDNTLYDVVIGNIDGSKLPDMSHFCAAVETRAQAKQCEKKYRKLKVPDQIINEDKEALKKAQAIDGNLANIRSRVKSGKVTVSRGLNRGQRPSKQFFSHVETEQPIPGYYQYFWGVNVSCSRKQHTDPAEDRTRVSRSGVRRSNH